MRGILEIRDLYNLAWRVGSPVSSQQLGEAMDSLYLQPSSLPGNQKKCLAPVMSWNNESPPKWLMLPGAYKLDALYHSNREQDNISQIYFHWVPLIFVRNKWSIVCLSAWSMRNRDPDHIIILCAIRGALVHSWNRTMRQTPVARNYRLAAIPRMNCLIVYSRSSCLVCMRLTGMSKNIQLFLKYTTRQVILGTAARR